MTSVGEIGSTTGYVPGENARLYPCQLAPSSLGGWGGRAVSSRLIRQVSVRQEDNEKYCCAGPEELGLFEESQGVSRMTHWRQAPAVNLDNPVQSPSTYRDLKNNSCKLCCILPTNTYTYRKKNERLLIMPVQQHCSFYLRVSTCISHCPLQRLLTRYLRS